jgi:predicted nuclease with TOPRIM domain
MSQFNKVYSNDLNDCIVDGLMTENKQLAERVSKLEERVSKLEIELEQADKDHVKDKVRLNIRNNLVKDRVLFWQNLYKSTSMLLDDARAVVVEMSNEKIGVSPGNYKFSSGGICEW